MEAFVVDVTKPPIPPPNRTIHEWWGETEASKQHGIDWEEYMQQYRLARQIDR